MAKRYRRELDQFLNPFGYKYTGFHGSDHYKYTNPDGQWITAPSSPSDWRWKQNLYGELRRRHPDLVRKPNSPRPKAERRTARRGDGREKRSFYIVPEVAEILEPLEPPERTSCIQCGRLWLSDLDPRGRSCPDCGGEVMIGRAA